MPAPMEAGMRKREGARTPVGLRGRRPARALLLTVSTPNRCLSPLGTRIHKRGAGLHVEFTMNGTWIGIDVGKDELVVGHEDGTTVTFAPRACFGRRSTLVVHARWSRQEDSRGVRKK